MNLMVTTWLTPSLGNGRNQICNILPSSQAEGNQVLNLDALNSNIFLVQEGKYSATEAQDVMKGFRIKTGISLL